MSWESDTEVQGVVLKEGAAPSGIDQAAIDKATADREDLAVGDTISVLDRHRPAHGHTRAAPWARPSQRQLRGRSDRRRRPRDRSGGVRHRRSRRHRSTSRWSTAPTSTRSRPRSKRSCRDGSRSDHRRAARPRSSSDADRAVHRRVRQPACSIFAFITAFVSGVHHQQRVQHHDRSAAARTRAAACRRCIGTPGPPDDHDRGVRARPRGDRPRHLRWAARGQGADRRVQRHGAGFPSPQTVLAPRTIVMAAVVGIGITMAVGDRAGASSGAGSRRSPRCDPSSDSPPSRPSGSSWASATHGGGHRDVPDRAVRPTGRNAGPHRVRRRRCRDPVPRRGHRCRRRSPAPSPVRSDGRSPSSSRRQACLARDNVARAPRRTSSSAAALMIGVALVSAAAVFASSLRATFIETLESAVHADYIVTDESFTGLSPIVSRRSPRFPSCRAVTPIPQRSRRGRRRVQAVRGRRPRRLRATGRPRSDRRDDQRARTQRAAHQLRSGSPTSASRSARPSPSRSRTARRSTSPWPASTATARSATGSSVSTRSASATDVPARDLFIVAGLADGVDPEVGDEAVRSAMAQFPQANVQSNAEFRAGAGGSDQSAARRDLDAARASPS